MPCKENAQRKIKNMASIHLSYDTGDGMQSLLRSREASRGEKKRRILSSKDKFVAECTARGFRGPMISRSLEIQVMKTYFLLEQSAF